MVVTTVTVKRKLWPKLQLDLSRSLFLGLIPLYMMSSRSFSRSPELTDGCSDKNWLFLRSMFLYT